MPTVTSANKAEFDRQEMLRHGLLKEDKSHEQVLERMSKDVPEDIENASFGHEGYVYHTPLRPIENSQQSMLGTKITPIHERAFASDKPIDASKINQIEARPISDKAIYHFAKELAKSEINGFMHKDKKRFSFIHESPKEKGKQQATEYDNQGAIKDSQHEDKATAIHQLINNGYTKVLSDDRLGGLIQKVMSK